MALDIQAHYQALYDGARAALDADGHSGISLMHVYSGDDQTGEPTEPPFVIYRQDVERSLGTTGGGPAKVLNSSWVFTSYSADLSSGLSYLTAIAAYFEENDPDQTQDGYVTTNVEVNGIQSLFEQADKFYACHLRLDWERSA